MKGVIAFLLLSVAALMAQKPKFLEGLGQGYNGEWTHASRQLIALAEAIPPEKYSWRPAPGVRSTGEILMHIAGTNFYLLSRMGHKMPADFESVDVEKIATDKAKVIDWLKRSVAAVRDAHANVTAAQLKKNEKFLGHEATGEGLYLRILVHANEHMGQLVAYARMNSVAPPWSDK
ncbi:MAG TPA: DinB family protein [Candidatus Sulfotelmatobacter sp.]